MDRHVRIGIDLDDVMAICAVPYLRKFAEEFGVQLPDDRQCLRVQVPRVLLVL